MKKKLLIITTTLMAAIGIVVMPLSVSPVSAAGLNVFEKSCGGQTTTTGGATDGGSGSADTPVVETPAKTDEGGSGSSTSKVPGGSASTICGANSQGDFSTLMSNIINTILVVLGMIAVVMIVIGGIRYTTSNGDASAIKGAKDTILYAVVGLVIAILSYAIVNFVLGRFS